MKTKNFLIAWLIASVVGWLLRGVFLTQVVDDAMRAEVDPVARMNLYSLLGLISMMFHGVILFLALEGLEMARIFRTIKEPLPEEEEDA